MLMLSCEPSILKVLIVDDHELIRLTLQLAFAKEENIQVVGLATNGQEAIESVTQFQPNIVVLDLQMPVMDGWSASTKIRAIAPKTQIIAYSSVEDNLSVDGYIPRMWDAYCRKDIPTKELVALIKDLGNKN
ncbi:MAG: response regulator transcription factor [Cyanobacteria bacterium P01_A01_bin.84]